MAFISGPVPEMVERRVTATPAQFERDLRAAWPVVGCVAGAFVIEADPLRLDIQIEALEMQRLGLFELPQLRVRFLFSGADEEARRQLLGMLDRRMQKGGG